jgi:hypothetical protein
MVNIKAANLLLVIILYLLISFDLLIRELYYINDNIPLSKSRSKFKKIKRRKKYFDF